MATYIQTDNDNRVVGIMEDTFVNELGEVVEQDVTGFFECDVPDDVLADSYNYLYVDGQFVYSESDSSKAANEYRELYELKESLPDAVADLSEMVSDNTVDVADIMDAVADLSGMVSDNTVDMADVMDAIAELSEIVSNLMEGE